MSTKKIASPLPGLMVGAGIAAAAYAYAPPGYNYVFGGVGALAIIESMGKFPAYQQQLDRERQSQTPSGKFGAARFASVADCDAAGLTNPNGLFLGSLDGTLLFFEGKGHLITESPARQGKGISAAIPNLLHCQNSMFVTDPKGELAEVTYRHRQQRFGQKVYIINPWGLHGLPQHRFNPIAHLAETYADPSLRRGLTEEVAALALQLLPEPEGEKNRFFREGARKILRALLLYLATCGVASRCTLVELWRMLQSPKRLQEALLDMALSEALDGMLTDIADDLTALMKDNPEQFGDFREGASQTVSLFEPAGWLANSVTASDFSFGDLKRHKATVYLVVPPDKVETYGRWMGLLTRRAIDSVARTTGRTKVLFLLDEVANMGKLAGLSESLTLLPGLGVRVWFIVQAMEQLVNLYGKNTAQVIKSQCEVKQYFAVQSFPLAKELSEQCGTKTVKTLSFNLGRELDGEIGESVGETGRPLIAPEEIMGLKPPKQLLFVKSLPPILADRVPFWDVDPWQGWAANNPVEGATPRPRPVYHLDYQEG